MSWNWNDAPGSSPSHRRKAILRKLFTSLLVGLLSVGVAWAGTGLVPTGATGNSTAGTHDGNWLQSVAGDEGSDSAAAAGAGTDESLQANQVYAGAYAVDIAPNPEKYNGEWETDQEHCETNAAPIGFGSPQETEPEHLADTRVRWNENINCIYTGGFDIGPAHAVSSFDEQYGLYARATAISDGEDTVVLMILDGAYYFAEYANMCNTVQDHPSDFDGDGPGANQYTQDCGFRQMQQSMAAKYGYEGPDSQGEFGIEPSSFFLASSHAHASPDFVGAWGGVPRWYMQQVEDAIREAVYTAIDTMQPTYVEASEILYRAGNNSRRRHYHAAEEAGYAWMRFVAEEDAKPVCTTPPPSPAPSPTGPPGQTKKETPSPTPTPTPSCSQPPPNKRAVATIGTYAAHPTNSSGGVAYGDLSAVYAKKAEARFGGTGLYFQTGFGNMTSGPGRPELAGNLVEMLPELGAGPQVTGNLDVKTTLRTFNHPVTNSALGGGGIAGIFDRPMGEGPAAVSISKNSLQPGPSHELNEDSVEDPGLNTPQNRCNSASPVSVRTSVSVARIGNLLITGGPGELFSNYTNTIKEKHANGLAFPLSLVNDGLGYIMQSVETEHVGRQAVGFVNGPLSEYEDAYSIDACFGDHALEQTLAGMDSL